MISMPEGAARQMPLAQARGCVETEGFVIVDVVWRDDGVGDGEAVAEALGLDTEQWAWLGRPAEDVRVEFDGESAAVVAPLAEPERVANIHAAATDRYVVIVHPEWVDLAAPLTAGAPRVTVISHRLP